MSRRFLFAPAVAAGLMLGAAFAASGASAATTTGRVVSVVDGDTARVAVGGRVRLVHLTGVRAPVATTCRGRLSSSSLTRLLRAGRTVTLVSHGDTVPRARSFAAEIYLDSRRGARSISQAQLLRGLAWVRTHRPLRSQHHSSYVAAELRARRVSRGVWGRRCQGAAPNSGVISHPGAVPVAPSPQDPSSGPSAPWPWQPALPDRTKPGGIGLEVAARGFTSPIYVTGRPGSTGLIVVEQGGKIRISRNGNTLGTPLLDLASAVHQGGVERGLLGLAFHPLHATNGLFYVSYVDTLNNTRIVEYYVPPGSDIATPESRRVLLTLAQPAPNHNGGHLAFGRDGMLYASLGDGGSNPTESQNLGTLLGSILRIDVNAAPYAVPADNPFVAMPGARGEIWAFGLRNPWRFSFDRLGDAMWIGDVGNDRREEINYRGPGLGGANFGWNAFEGSLSHVGTLGPGPHIGPVAELDHSSTSNCSVTGGYVYRGSAVPGLYGKYVFSDFCTGNLWTVDAANPSAGATEITGQIGTDLAWVTSFGEDISGELYVIGGGGTIYRFTAK